MGNYCCAESRKDHPASEVPQTKINSSGDEEFTINNQFQASCQKRAQEPVSLRTKRPSHFRTCIQPVRRDPPLHK